MDAGVETSVALNSHAGSVQLGVPLNINEVKEVPGRWPPAKVQRVKPERLVRDEYVVVAHDDALRRLPQPLWRRKREGGRRRGGRRAVALNANAPSRRCHSMSVDRMHCLEYRAVTVGRHSGTGSGMSCPAMVMHQLGWVGPITGTPAAWSSACFLNSYR